MEYKIDRLVRENFNQLIPLMQDCFGMNVNVEYFQWKFLLNPAGEFIGYVAKDDQDRVVAFEGLIPVKYWSKGEEKIFFHSVDTMTHSGHRRKGLYQKLAAAGYEYLKKKNQLFIYGFGGKMSTPALLKFGWKTLFDITFYFRTRQQIIFNKLFLYKSKTDFSLKEIINVEEIFPLIKKNERKQGVFLKTDIEFVKWKLNNPRHDYKITGIYDIENILKGYIIFYYENNKIMLFDFGFIENARHLEKIIFRWLDDQILKRKLKGIITFSQERTMFSEMLLRNGFIKNPFRFGPMREKLPFMVYTDKKTISDINDPYIWSIRPFDHDAF
jgi:hypothetical protein